MFIYGYANPITKEIFYVGKTNNMEKRNYAHMRYSKGKNKYFSYFISRLRHKGLVPLHVVLEICPEEIVLDREKFWIEFGSENRWPLTNRVHGNLAKKNGAQNQIDYINFLLGKIEAI